VPTTTDINSSSSESSEEEQQANNLVAQSDYQATLDAFEQVFLTPPNGSTFHRACHDSLVRNLTRMVQPISDEAFQDYVDQYHCLEDDSSDDDMDDGQHHVMEEEIHDGSNLMEEEEYESEDLLDLDALEEAQDLRAEVCQLAQRVQMLRDSVIQRVRRMQSFLPTIPPTSSTFVLRLSFHKS
jgi:hypothetical protein